MTRNCTVNRHSMRYEKLPTFHHFITLKTFMLPMDFNRISAEQQVKPNDEVYHSTRSTLFACIVNDARHCYRFGWFFLPRNCLPRWEKMCLFAYTVGWYPSMVHEVSCRLHQSLSLFCLTAMESSWLLCPNYSFFLTKM